MKTKDKVIDWLLENENPPVRYLTLTNLLKRSKSSSEVQEAKAHLMQYKVTQGILKHSKEFWKNDDRSYWKYTGKYWQLIFLGQFLTDGKDLRIAEEAHAILERRKWVMENGVQCLTANLLTAFRRLGYADHPIVIQETESLAKRIIEDKGLKCTAMDYSLLPRCYMALPKQLLAFAEIPSSKRSKNIQTVIEFMVQRMFENDIYIYVPSKKKEWQKILKNAPKRADLPKGQRVKDWILDRKHRFLKSDGIRDRTAKQGWFKFGFPSHYNSNILEAMYALALLKKPMTPTT